MAARAPKLRWYMIPARALFATFLLTLLSFAVALLLSIVAMVIVGKLHGTPPDLRFAYRHIAIPVSLVVGSVVLILSLVMEIRHYRQAKALDAIVRISR